MAPIDEVRTVMAAFDETLFTVVPGVPGAGRGAPGRPDPRGRAPPAVPAFLRFGSWVGADRDGNPFVTAQVTRETAVIQADHVLRALENATTRIGRALTVHADAAPPRPDSPLALEAAETAHPELLADLAARSPQEPYRTYLLYLAARLEATRLRHADLAYRSAAEFLADLLLVQDVAGRRRCRPAGVWRTAAFDLAGARRSGSTWPGWRSASTARCMPGRLREITAGGAAVGADQRGARHVPGGGLDPGPVRRGRLPPVRGQLHPVGRRHRRRP